MMKSKYLRGVIVSAVLVAFGGCGGGGGGNDQQENEQQEQVADTIAPGISSTLPASEEAGIDRSAVITAFFDEDILSSTVANTSFSLVGNGPVDGTVNFDSETNKATFTPAQPLSILTHYTATLGADITDLAGNALGGDYSWSFSTADGTLTTAADQVFSDPSAVVLKPKVIYHDDGDAIAVWVTALDDIQLWASHFSVDSGWGTPVRVSTGSQLKNLHFSLAADDSGNALVAWHMRDAGVWVNHYDRDTATWGSPVSLNDGTPSGGAQVALDNNGNAIAVWSEGTGAVSDIWASYYTAGIGWGSPELIELGAGYAYELSIDLDDSGNAIAIWQQDDGTQMSIYANRFVIGAGWGTATLLENSAFESWDPAVAMDDDGNAIAIWTEINGTRRDLWSNRYDAVDGWGSAVLLENHSENAGDLQLAMNNSGTAIVAWAKYNVDTNIGSYASKRFIPGEGWGPEETFEYSGESYYYSDLAIDNSGNALFFWEYDDGSNGTLWMNRYTADGGWATATELTSIGDDWGDSSPAVSVKSDGEGMLIFVGSSTTEQQVWTRLFQ